MKTLTLILLLSMMVECEQPGGERVKGNGYSTITIEGCQYIEVSSMIGSNAGYYSLTHKGNCNNPIHHPDTIVR